ncbi:unnamed protein product, partial [Staurois parvus]
WGPWAIGDHGAPVSLPKLKKAYEKGTRGISWGPLLTPGPRAVPKFPNGQSAPGSPWILHNHSKTTWKDNFRLLCFANHILNSLNRLPKYAFWKLFKICLYSFQT